MPKHSLPHLAARLFGCPLLIAPRKFEAILAVIGPRIGLSEPLTSQAMQFDDEEEEDESQSSGSSYQMSDNGIAIVPIQGPLVKKSSFVSSICGITSYGQIEQNIVSAMSDPAVKGILLDIDSPGGEASGAFDLSDAIYAMRGTKPIVAIANDDMYSAAYAIGSAADQVFVTRTGGVGSIGVIAMHVDQSGADEKAGLKYTPIYAGAHKNDLSSHQPLTNGAKATMQAHIDDIYGLFVQTVARNRGLSAQKIKNTEAGLFFGPSGIDSGLADYAGSSTDALSALDATTRPIAPFPAQPFQFAATSVAAISQRGESTIVPDTNTAADTTPAVTQPVAAPPVVAPPAAAAPTLPTYTAEDVEETIELCAMAGKDINVASGFIQRRMRPSDVRKQLAAERVRESEQGGSTTSAVTPGMGTAADNTVATAGAKGAAPTIPLNILLEDADERRKASEARRAQNTNVNVRRSF